MPESTAHRTLVKSPPELWAEVSDAAALAKHLGEFGEIRITRLEPETTVAWEGDRASGTVRLEPSGWGTKVTLTAELAEIESVQAAPEPVAVEPEPVPEPEPEPEPEPVAVEPEPELFAAEPEPALEPAPPPPPAPPAKKPGLFARLFGGRKAVPPPAPAVAPPAPEPRAPEPKAEAPSPVPRPAPEPRAPEPKAEAPSPVPPPPEPIRPPEPDPPEPAAAENAATLTEESAVAVLTSVLDDLGSAHHRPFSRS